ncbi:hypothetical protein MVES1_004018 [Malassezia vespertilionis]|uniref:triacylglycerol lipase n=1 Tax=Malassezia vespertilionis TaxID=2020962 RepID=A0A2N1J7I0_9BASI|nr:uncharacterized protein MVES1_004018 [Malassezia vespertilionis]PKI82518.1 hypothetical protein MVES_003567 [Malassezia vespertilionis]WFD08641.1 hypothetical protein MVES1_004018 [Malassezia vespertilionis]
MKLILFVSFFAALCHVLAVTKYPGNGPTPGDFEYPPDGYENTEPGTILRSRKIDPAFFGIADISGKAWQVLYRTSAQNDSMPMATLTTILVPDHFRNDRLLLHQAIEDSASFVCRPSLGLMERKLPAFENILQRLEMLLISTYMAQGWVVSVSDYEGPMSAFAVGPLSGYATLDAARATLNFEDTGLDRSKTKIQGVGYSGGAIASSWAAQLQKSYAPELNIVGWAFGGTPANLTYLVEKADGTAVAGLIALGATGVLNGYPELHGAAEKYLTDTAWRAVNQVRNSCEVGSIVPFAFQTIQSEKYIHGGLHLADVPGVNEVIANLTLARGKAAPIAPVYMFHALTDPEVPYPPAIDAARRWCANGAQVEFTTAVLGLEHISTYIGMFSRMFDWLEKRFEGKPLKSRKCQFKYITNAALNPVDDIKFAGHALEVVKTLLGEMTGMEKYTKEQLQKKERN